MNKVSLDFARFTSALGMQQGVKQIQSMIALCQFIMIFYILYFLSVSPINPGKRVG